MIKSENVKPFVPTKFIYINSEQFRSMRGDIHIQNDEHRRDFPFFLQTLIKIASIEMSESVSFSFVRRENREKVDFNVNQAQSERFKVERSARIGIVHRVRASC